MKFRHTLLQFVNLFIYSLGLLQLGSYLIVSIKAGSILLSVFCVTLYIIFIAIFYIEIKDELKKKK